MYTVFSHFIVRCDSHSNITGFTIWVYHPLGLHRAHTPHDSAERT